MLELRMALKNLWRHRRRTVLTAVVIAFGVLLYAVMDSLILGTEEDSFRNLVRYELAQVEVYPAGLWAKRQEPSLDYLVPDGEALAARLRQVEGVRGATAQLRFAANVNTGAEELPVTAVGTDPRTDGEVFALRDTLKAGRYLKPGQPEALVGRELANLMGLKVGDTFTLVFRTHKTTFQALDLAVVGLVAASDPAVNSGTVYLPLGVAQQAAGAPGAVSQLMITGAPNYHRLGVLPDRVREALAGRGLDVRTWQDWAVSYLAHTQADRKTTGLILALIGVLAGLGLVNNLLLAGMERSREIGTLKALGMTERQITLLFMLEGAGVGLLGGAFGALLASGAVAYLVWVGLDYSALTSDYSFNLAVEGVFHGLWNWPTILGAVAGSVLVAFVMSYWPARRSARQDPAVVLRG